MPIKLNWDNFSVNHSEQNIYVTVDQMGGDLLIATVGPDVRTFTDVVDRSPTVSLEYAIETVGIKQGILAKAISGKINIPMAKPMIVRPSSNTITIESLSPLLIDWGDGEVQVEETINATSNLDIESGLPTKIYTHTFTDGFEDKIIKISHFDNASPIRFFTSDAIKEVVQWYGAGYDGALTNLTEKPRLVAFYGLGPELIRVPDVGPKTTIYAGLFENARIFNQPLNNWDTSLVTSMYGMFKRCLAFNQPLDSWDVSSVQDFSYMFEGAIQFNQNLPSWSTGNATDMSHMFAYAEAFNGEISAWIISNVKTLRAMFKMCYVFNQPLDDWDTSNVTDLTSTFSEAGLFNQPLNNWDTSNVTSLKHTFNRAYSFNQPLSNWITDLVESMAGTFKNASSFDQNIHGWSVKLIESRWYQKGWYPKEYKEFNLNCPLRFGYTPMWGTEQIRSGLIDEGFRFKASNTSTEIEALYFEFNIDESEVLETILPYEVYVNGEFHGGGFPSAEKYGRHYQFTIELNPGDEFDIDIRGMIGSLELSSDSTGWWPADETNPEPTPLTGKVEILNWATKENIHKYNLMLGQIELTVPAFGPLCSNYSRMFESSAAFNDPNVSLWDISHVTDISYMFAHTINFNQPLNNWDTSNVTDFSDVLAWCHAFNQPLNNWNVFNAINMEYMFCDSYKFNSSVDGWVLGPNLTNCRIFADNYSFNLPIDSWDLTQAKTLNGLFNDSIYNQPLNGLNVSNIENMSSMFAYALNFNQPLDQWDVSNVTDMQNMFWNSKAFNQPIGMWDVSNVIIMESMFEDASVFNQYLGTWDTRNVDWESRFYKTFGGQSTLQVANYPNWALGPIPEVLTTEFSPEGVTPLISIITTERPSLAAYFKGVPSGGIIVDWGDGIIEKFVNNSGERLGSDTGVQTWTHQYQVAGEYTIKVYPLSKLRLLRINGCCEVSDWGNTPIDGFELTDTSWSMDTSWLRKVPTYLPSYVISTKSMFYKAITFNDPSITSWDTSNVTDMTYMFHGAKVFNQPIGNWNTSKVTNMSYMFSNAFLFNQPLNNWDTSNVEIIEAMFYSAKAFNQPLDQWDVSKTTSMLFMFHETLAFDQPLNTWDVSNVTRMTYMFRGAANFNQPLDQWNVGNVTDMGWMFEGASAFDQDISPWDMRKVKTIRSMFYKASRFNKPVNSWKLLSVTELIGVFEEALLFNQPLDQWDTSKATAMAWMFRGAVSFNQPIDSWDVGNVTDMGWMFYNASSFNQDLKNWCVSYFTSAPSYFVTNATNFLPANLPVWGTCPLRESHYVY